MTEGETMNSLTTDSHDRAQQAQASGPAIVSSWVEVPSLMEALVDPAGVFQDPAAILTYPWFGDGEKRAILLSWARDELVLEQVANRALPELRPKSRIDGVIDALARFDSQAASEHRAAVARIRAPSSGRRGGRIALSVATRQAPGSMRLSKPKHA
jgi:hypothetical protein